MKKAIIISGTVVFILGIFTLLFFQSTFYTDLRTAKSYMEISTLFEQNEDSLQFLEKVVFPLNDDFKVSWDEKREDVIVQNGSELSQKEKERIKEIFIKLDCISIRLVDESGKRVLRVFLKNLVVNTGLKYTYAVDFYGDGNKGINKKNEDAEEIQPGWYYRVFVYS